MRLIIAGGRGYDFTSANWDRLDDLHAAHPVTAVLSGGAPGADHGGEVWARSRGIPVEVYAAEWGRWGSSAGPRRNREMASRADAVVLFPGGAGTQNMHDEARARDLRIFDWRATSWQGAK